MCAAELNPSGEGRAGRDGLTPGSLERTMPAPQLPRPGGSSGTTAACPRLCRTQSWLSLLPRNVDPGARLPAGDLPSPLSSSPVHPVLAPKILIPDQPGGLVCPPHWTEAVPRGVRPRCWCGEGGQPQAGLVQCGRLLPAAAPSVPTGRRVLSGETGCVAFVLRHKYSTRSEAQQLPDVPFPPACPPAPGLS